MRTPWGLRLAAVAVLSAVAIGAFPGAASAGTTEENLLFDLINNKRVNKGKKELVEHAKMLGQARRHSENMAARNRISHDGFEARVNRIRNADGGINGGVCENVAYARGYTTAEEALRVIFRGWRQSTGHNQCMLDKLGYSAESGALGLKKSGNTWWATFIAAHDANP